MEGGDDVHEIQDHDPLENQDLSFLHTSAGDFVAEYGWYVLFLTMGVYLLIQHLSKKWASHSSNVSEPVQDPLSVTRKQEAMEASRLRMQEELDAKAALFRERQQELEEEKRRQKIEMWDNMKEGKSYKAKIAQSTEEASTSTTALKPKTDKKPLRNSDYNPLSGEGGGGACGWRPGRRGPSSGGG